MEQELLDVIKKNLPEAAAGEMKKFIEQANQTKINLEKSEAKIEGLNEQIEEKSSVIKFKDGSIANLNKTVEELNDQINKCEDCQKRYMQLGYKEQIINIQEQCADSRIYDMKEVVSLVFKSPVFRKQSTVSTSKSKNVPYQDNQNGYQTTMINTETENSTVSTTENIVEEDNAGNTTHVYSASEAQNWFLSNHTGSLTCICGVEQKICLSYPEAETFFNNQ